MTGGSHAIASGKATLAGSASVSARGVYEVAGGAASLDVSSETTLEPWKVSSASVALQGDAALPAAPIRVQRSVAALGGGASLTTLGGVIKPFSATLDGSGSEMVLSYGLYVGRATLTGTAQLDAHPVKMFLGSATLAGEAGITCVAGNQVFMDGTSTTTLRPTVIRRDTAQPLDGVATVQIDGHRDRLANAWFDGQLSVAADGLRYRYGDLAVSGDVTLGATAKRNLDSTAAFDTTGQMDVSGKLTAGGAVTLAGTSETELLTSLPARLDATSSMTVRAEVLYRTSVSMASTGSELVVGDRLRLGETPLHGVATLGHFSRIIAGGAAQLEVTSTTKAFPVEEIHLVDDRATVTPDPSVLFRGRASLNAEGGQGTAGEGGLDVVVIFKGKASLSSKGRMKVLGFKPGPGLEDKQVAVRAIAGTVGARVI
jgi:hypothetical protein